MGDNQAEVTKAQWLLKNSNDVEPSATQEVLRYFREITLSSVTFQWYFFQIIGTGRKQEGDLELGFYT